MNILGNMSKMMKVLQLFKLAGTFGMVLNHLFVTFFLKLVCCINLYNPKGILNM